MPQPLALYLLVGIVGGVVLALVVAKQLGYLNFLGEDNSSSSKALSADYRVRDAVLSPAERSFLAALHEALGVSGRTGNVVLFPSVRLAEVLSVDSSESGNRSAWRSAFNRVSSKQADFVLCDSATTRPLLVIELDDKSHARSDRRARDAFVDKACESAGLPILHVTAAATYDTRMLAAKVVEKLGAAK